MIHICFYRQKKSDYDETQPFENKNLILFPYEIIQKDSTKEKRNVGRYGVISCLYEWPMI